LKSKIAKYTQERCV